MRRRKTVCIVQARMGSSRLPGKVLTDVAGSPLIDRVLCRLKQARCLNQIVVATSDLPQDRVLIEHCQARGIDCFAGSHDDVLDRFMRAAETFSADVILRITADCPLIDPTVVDKTTAMLLADANFDCTCNFFPRRTFPRGLDCEAITRATLEQVATTEQAPRFREHVTLAIYENSDRFRIGSVTSPQDYSALRWTVDEPADLSLVREIYAAFGSRPFTWFDCLRAYRQHPQWRGLNAQVEQKVA